jgi:hypothetical protein
MRKHRLTAGEERLVILIVVIVVTIVLAMLSTPTHAAQTTLHVYGKASPKVCEARMVMTGTKIPWIFRGTYTVYVPSCPRPQPVTLCLFDDGPKLTFH